MRVEQPSNIDQENGLFGSLPNIFPQKTETVTASEEWLEKCEKATGIPACKLADMSRKERRALLKERGLMKASRGW